MVVVVVEVEVVKEAAECSLLRRLRNDDSTRGNDA